MATNALRTYCARSGTSATNTTAVSCVAATAKSVISVLGAATDTLGLIRVSVSFDSITATAVPALVEIGITTTLGTVTSLAPAQLSGSPLASSVTAGYNASAEPTYNRIIDSFYCPVFNGFYRDWLPLGFEPSCAVSQGFAIRVTAPATVNCLASLVFAE